MTKTCTQCHKEDTVDALDIEYSKRLFNDQTRDIKDAPWYCHECTASAIFRGLTAPDAEHIFKTMLTNVTAFGFQVLNLHHLWIRGAMESLVNADHFWSNMESVLAAVMEAGMAAKRATETKPDESIN